MTKNRENVFSGIIINVGTKLISTLSLMAAKKYANMPIILINCPFGNIDDSEYFLQLKKVIDFELINWDLDSHGKTLDKIFQNIESQYILCIDSDLEILNSEIVDFSKKLIQNPTVYGSGFLHFSEWQINPANLSKIDGLYMERPYMPFALFNREKVLEGLEAGYSFEMVSKKSNSFQSRKRRFFNLLMSKMLSLGPKNTVLEKSFFNFYSNPEFMINYDTGSLIHEYLRFEKRYDFVGLPHRLQDLYVKHYSGITRLLTNENDQNFTTNIENVSMEIKNKLFSQFNFDYDNFISKY